MNEESPFGEIVSVISISTVFFTAGHPYAYGVAAHLGKHCGHSGSDFCFGGAIASRLLPRSSNNFPSRFSVVSYVSGGRDGNSGRRVSLVGAEGCACLGCAFLLFLGGAGSFLDANYRRSIRSIS